MDNKWTVLSASIVLILVTASKSSGGLWLHENRARRMHHGSGSTAAVDDVVAIQGVPS